MVEEPSGKAFDKLVDYLRSGRPAVVVVAGILAASTLFVLLIPNPSVRNAVDQYEGWLWIAFYVASVTLVACWLHWQWVLWWRRYELAQTIDSLTVAERAILDRFLAAGAKTLDLVNADKAVDLLRHRGLIRPVNLTAVLADSASYRIRDDVWKQLRRQRT